MLAGDLSAFTQARHDEDRRRRLEAASHRVSTIRELLGPAREYLEGKGVPSPKLDAEYLLAHVLGVPRLELYLDHDRELDAAEVDSLRDLVRRRGKREPLAYVLGSWNFYGLELHCDPARARATSGDGDPRGALPGAPRRERPGRASSMSGPAPA